MEFQAVLLAGYGQRLYHLVDDVPKPLLPIANTPMIEYVLQWLENAGISSIFVISTPESSSKLSHYLSKVYENQTLGARIELVTVDAYGSADALRAVKDKITTDFFVVSCDVLTDFPLEKMMDSFRLNDPAMISLFTSTIKLDYTGIGMKEIEPITFTGLDSRNEKILSLDIKEPSDDMDDRYSYLNVYMQILNEHGTVNLYSNLVDSHVYLMKKWLLDWICAEEDIINLREDFFPLLVKCQFSKSLRDNKNLSKFICESGSSFYHQDLSSLSEEQLQLLPAMRHLSLAANSTGSSSNSTGGSTDSQKTKIPVKPSASIVSSVGTSDSSPKLSKSSSVDESQALKCLALVNLSSELSLKNYCVRVNTIPAFFEMNRLIDKPLNGLRLADTADITPTSQIGPDSLVGDGTKIGERTSIKKSVIGAHCTIGKFVKISNSVIMDYVTIDEGVKLENCIICSGSNIQAKANLRDCEVGYRYNIESGTNAKGEHFIESRTMSADEEDY